MKTRLRNLRPFAIDWIKVLGMNFLPHFSKVEVFPRGNFSLQRLSEIHTLFRPHKICLQRVLNFFGGVKHHQFLTSTHVTDR